MDVIIVSLCSHLGTRARPRVHAAGMEFVSTLLAQAGLQPDVVEVLLSPEILIGSGSYLLLKPILKRSRLVDKSKGAYKTSVRWLQS